MAKKSNAYNDILAAIESRQFAPVYLFMGEEAFYIDRLTDAIDRCVLTEDEKSFNQVTVYCTADTDAGEIINMAKRYPMMSEYLVVIVKEAQNLKKIDDLSFYVQNPLQTTILVISYKHGTLDKRKKLANLIDKVGVVYESERLKEFALPEFIDGYLKETNKDGVQLTIDPKAKGVLVQHIGSDLSRMTGELDKLRITMPAGETVITTNHIERNIGISKDFNVWELNTAIVNKDIFKANQIISYFNDNPKTNPPILTINALFRLFAGFMQAFYAPDRSEHGLMQHLGLRSPYQLKDYTVGMKNYSARKVMDIIAKLRETDAKLKGVGKGNTPDSDIMNELIFFILH